MQFLKTAYLDPFLVGLLLVVLTATLFPATGGFMIWVKYLSKAAIFLLFFLHGAKLSRSAILAGITNWRLHLLVLLTTFGLFPILGLAAYHVAQIWAPITALGLLYLTLLPSTVQSSIAFTSIAGGNVAAAVCSASISNLAGTVITPLLVSLAMGVVGGNLDLSAAMEQIALQLLLPFFAGHLSRPWTADFFKRHGSIISKVDRGSVMLVVYGAFSSAVVQGLWNKMSTDALLFILVVSAVILAIVLLATWGMANVARFNRPDSIVLLFCGSKKSSCDRCSHGGDLLPGCQGRHDCAAADDLPPTPADRLRSHRKTTGWKTLSLQIELALCRCLRRRGYRKGGHINPGFAAVRRVLSD